MTPSARASLLSWPATAAAADIARERIAAATRAADRLADGTDGEALHDFRVALRRLRSALRAYHPWLGRAASRSVRSALRDLGRATNVGRDAEVQAEWVTRAAPNLSEHARTGAEKLAGRLKKHRELRATELRDVLCSVTDKISKRLDFLQGESPAFVTVYAALLREHAAAAAARLAAVTAAEQVEEAHEARIAVKRLRYLLEPLVDELAGAKPVLARIEELQDLLGELHDSHVLDEALAEAGAARHASKRTLTALAAENAKRRNVVFAELEGHWVGSVATSFFEQIQRLVTST